MVLDRPVKDKVETKRKSGIPVLKRVRHRNGMNSQKETVSSADTSQVDENPDESSSETSDENVVDSIIETRKWKTQHYDHLPEWMQDNHFLHKGHRPPLPSFAACAKSIFSIHCETGNIWTHLLGSVAFVAMAVWFLTRPPTEVQMQEKILFSIFFISAITCMGMSFTFHTVSCHSVGVRNIFRKLDHVGISILIVGSFIPWLYYGFYCHRTKQLGYIAMITVLGIGTITVTLIDKFSGPKYRPLRAGMFSAMGLSAVIPAIHFLITDGLKTLVEEAALHWLLLMAFLYLFGAALYASRIPERFFPGKCDLLCQSHQLFHTCVVAAAVAHYYGISEVALNRIQGAACPA